MIQAKLSWKSKEILTKFLWGQFDPTVISFGFTMIFALLAEPLNQGLSVKYFFPWQVPIFGMQVQICFGLSESKIFSQVRIFAFQFSDPIFFMSSYDLIHFMTFVNVGSCSDLKNYAIWIKFKYLMRQNDLKSLKN